MKCEIPELGRCCFCFPLRLGLIVWSYIKLIATVMLLTAMMINLIVNWERFLRIADTYFVIIYFVFILSMAADTTFLIIFAIGAHRKDPKMMDLFSKFCIYIILLYFSCFCCSIVFFSNADHISFYMSFFIGSISFSCAFCQIYVIILVRSEVLKLKRASNFEFINHGAGTTDSGQLHSDDNDA